MILLKGEIVVTKNNPNHEWIFEGYMIKEPLIHGHNRDCYVTNLDLTKRGAFYSYFLIPKYRRFVLVEKTTVLLQ